MEFYDMHRCMGPKRGEWKMIDKRLLNIQVPKTNLVHLRRTTTFKFGFFRELVSVHSARIPQSVRQIGGKVISPWLRLILKHVDRVTPSDQANNETRQSGPRKAFAEKRFGIRESMNV